MRTFDLNDGVIFDEKHPHAESIHSNDDGRALRFAFLPGQVLGDHDSPNSAIHLVVLQGSGEFTGGDGRTQLCTPGTLIVIDPGETHSVRALDEKLVFLTILKGTEAHYESEHRKMLEAEGQDG